MLFVGHGVGNKQCLFRRGPYNLWPTYFGAEVTISHLERQTLEYLLGSRYVSERHAFIDTIQDVALSDAGGFEDLPDIRPLGKKIRLRPSSVVKHRSGNVPKLVRHGKGYILVLARHPVDSVNMLSVMWLRKLRCKEVFFESPLNTMWTDGTGHPKGSFPAIPESPSRALTKWAEARKCDYVIRRVSV